MNALLKFIPITKIDAAKRLVYGVATAEKVDRAGEICDYETTKPLYEKWSGEIAKATDGKSLGNVRAMHGNVAAGKLTEMIPNDAEKQFEICAKVVDDAEWAKVEEGVYTGFSQGGKYVKRWKDEDGHVRYTADPVEISLVDLPCLPESTFQMIKADGASEIRKFASVVTEPTITEIGNRADAMAKAAGGGKSFREFIDAAQQELLDERVTEAQKALEAEDLKADGHDVEKSTEVIEQTSGETDKPAETKKAKKWVEPKQIWDCGHAEHQHLTKAEAVRCMKDADTAEDVAKMTAPADEALKRLEALVDDSEVEKADKKDDDKPYGDVDYADPGYQDDGKKRYPLDTEKHIRAAWSYINKAKNQKPYTSEQVDKIKSKIVAAWKDKIDKDGPPSADDKADKSTQPKMAKGMYSVSQLAMILEQIEWLQDSTEIETAYEADGSAIPSQLNAWCAQGCAILRDMVAEETAEMADDDDVDVVMEMAAHFPMSVIEQLAKAERFKGLVEKVGARHSKTDLARVQKVHDLACELGAGCNDGDDDSADKSAGADELHKLQTENEALKSQLSNMGTRLDAVTAKVEQMSKGPAPAKAAVRAVGKTEDSGDGASGAASDADDFAKRLDAMNPEDRNRELMKLALKFPRPGHPYNPAA